MRFLFGDSTPFPLGFNFLATLEAFMTAATRIVQLDLESRQLTRHTDDLAQGRVKGLDALDQFHAVVLRAVQDTAQKVQHPNALEYAARVGEFASRYVEDQRRSILAANERESVVSRSENERRIAEQRVQLENFLKVGRLPVIATRLTMKLAGEGKDVAPQMMGAFDHPDGIQTAFTLDAGRSASWATPRKVSDLVQGMELMVGVDKSWLRGTVSPKQMSVDDWIFGGFEVSDDAFDLALRRKAGERDALSFRMRRTEMGLVGTVDHPGQPQAEALGHSLAPADVPKLERIWLALRTASRDVLEHKLQLLAASLDGQPIFEAQMVVPFVVRLVAMFAPTVREIARRSPNDQELSLKMESEGGRREELYLRKEQLVSRLQPMPAVGREVFAPLGLDTWVPGVTTAPPPVVSNG